MNNIQGHQIVSLACYIIKHSGEYKLDHAATISKEPKDHCILFLLPKKYWLAPAWDVPSFSSKISSFFVGTQHHRMTPRQSQHLHGRVYIHRMSFHAGASDIRSNAARRGEGRVEVVKKLDPIILIKPHTQNLINYKNFRWFILVNLLIY